jgi:hypothetical protein
MTLTFPVFFKKVKVMTLTFSCFFKKVKVMTIDHKAIGQNIGISKTYNAKKTDNEHI